jgi:anti-sigma factor RsiW
MQSILLPDRAGRLRSPATTPTFHRGVPPREAVATLAAQATLPAGTSGSRACDRPDGEPRRVRSSAVVGRR